MSPGGAAPASALWTSPPYCLTPHGQGTAPALGGGAQSGRTEGQEADNYSITQHKLQGATGARGGAPLETGVSRKASWRKRMWSNKIILAKAPVVGKLWGEEQASAWEWWTEVGQQCARAQVAEAGRTGPWTLYQAGSQHGSDGVFTHAIQGRFKKGTWPTVWTGSRKSNSDAAVFSASNRAHPEARGDESREGLREGCDCRCGLWEGGKGLPGTWKEEGQTSMLWPPSPPLSSPVTSLAEPTWKHEHKWAHWHTHSI